MGFGLNDIFHSSQLVGPLVDRKFAWRELAYTTLVLPFNMQAQTQTNWCWAATATSTSLFYRPSSNWTQCKVASTGLGLSCCVSPVPGPCNIPWYLNQALTVTDNFVSITGPISFQAVQAELQTGRVLGARVGWSGGGGHFMVIYGCSTVGGVQYLNIDDPIYGKSNPSFSTFSNNYQGSGSWTHTYYTKAAPSVFKLRIPELAQWVLEPIWRARPLLAAQEGRAAEFAEDAVDRGTSFGLAHPVHVLGLRDLAERSGLPDRPTALRVLEAKDGEPVAFYDVSPERDGELLQMASDNDYMALLSRGLAAASPRVEEGKGEAELQLLRIPALNTEALVLKPDRGEELVVVIRSLQPDIPLFEPLSLKALLDRLEEPARRLLDEDDDLKGS